ncbi:MAG TPA: MFS transporter, partial [Ktedonobacterales bacterium]|nr:MFS transporter [Ktedonobacterales bacterium]
LNRADDEAAYGGGGPQVRRGFDIWGLLLSMSGCATLVYGISEAGNNGWGDATVDRFLIIGILLVAAFIVVELRSQDPVIDVRLFTNYTFTIANILTWAMGAFLFGSLFLLPLFFENVRNYTALSTGEIFISQGLAAAVGVVISGRLYNRLGPRFFVVIGMALITLGTYGMTRLNVNTTGGDLTLWLICRGMGLGFVNTSLQTVAVSKVSNRAMARASSLINVTRQMFAALGVASLSTYLAQQGKTHGTTLATAFQNTPAFAQVKTQCATQFGHVGATAIAQCIQKAVVNHVTPLATTSALNDTFVVAMIGCGIAAALALFLGRDPALQALRQGQGVTSTESESGEPQPALLAE